MNLQSIFGGISIGKDTTGNFRSSLKGLAVRASPGGEFLTLDGKNLVDVSDLTIEGTEQYVYRLPVQSVKAGDLIITSESPFAALFVQEVVRADGHLLGLDPYNLQVEYTPPTNLFNVRFFVTVVSLLDLNGPIGAQNLLPLLLLGNKGDNSGMDGLTTILLLQALGGTAFGEDNLLPLLLFGGAGDALETMLLLQAQRGGKNPFESLSSNEPRGPRPTAVKRARQRKTSQK
jgi:hypothetical protein